MRKTTLGLRWLGLIALLLGISWSYTILAQAPPAPPKPASTKADQPLTLFSEEDLLQSGTRLNRSRKLFKQAYTSFQQGNFQQAQTKWSALVGNYPELGDYVYHNLGKSEVALNQHLKAIGHWRELISQFPGSRLVNEARLGMADSYFVLRDFAQASVIYQQLLDVTWSDEQVLPTVYQKLALCFEQQKDFPRAITLYHQLWLNYPTSAQAEVARQNQKSLGREHSLPLPALTEKDHWKRIYILIQQGEYATASQELAQFRKQFSASPLIPNTYLKQSRCYKGQQKSSQAIKSLKELIRRFPEHKLVAEARYKLARMYWNKGLDQQATNYLHHILKDPKARHWQNKAYYILARIHEENRKYFKAVENYQQLITKFPTASLANMAYWRVGWIDYCYLKDYAKAIDSFAKVTLSANKNADLYFSALYWQGRCREELEQWSQAGDLYISLTEQVAYTYYAQLAEQRLADLKTGGRLAQSNKPLPALGDKPSLAADPFLINRLLTETDKFHLQRVRELAALLIFEDSLRELDKLSRPVNPPPEYWYHLSKLYHLLGGYTRSIRLIQRVVDHAREKGLVIPAEVWRVCYPLNYWPVIQKQAETEGLSPYLIAAVIRQESVFDPDSLSRANAIGLMQVIPSTGKAISHKLRLTKFNPDMLYDPGINLALGSHYLAHLLNKFKANLALTLAAYNAGEKAANKWWRERKSDDIAQFRENIPYPETRKYVKLVWSNYNNYRRIYKGKPELVINE